jgi:hypothetical protein
MCNVFEIPRNPVERRCMGRHIDSRDKLSLSVSAYLKLSKTNGGFQVKNSVWKLALHCGVGCATKTRRFPLVSVAGSTPPDSTNRTACGYEGQQSPCATLEANRKRWCVWTRRGGGGSVFTDQPPFPPHPVRPPALSTAFTPKANSWQPT